MNLIKKYFVYLIIISLLLLTLVPLQSRINKLRVKEELVETDIFESTTPSDVWGTLLLAGFRGVAVDMLWVRAIALQQEEKYFELITIYNIILDLQPRFANIWAYSAWNMAYNIAYEMETPEERWKWIKEGISLLEDKGIKKNSKNYLLYFELGWIYFHRCDAEPYYYQQLKKETGKSNHEFAVGWFKKAAQINPHPAYIENMIAHAWEKAAFRAQEEGDIEKRDAYLQESIHQWEENLRNKPDDLVIWKNYQRVKQIMEGEE